ncbi:pantoate--beta-alanine ligase [Caldicellulosiruptoraceae bacterium PP1]
MIIIESIKEMKDYRNKMMFENKTIGFVPTMGYLHDGHLSLAKKAKEENDIVVMSIFVNPIQFGPNEDFERYPRDFERDKNLAQSVGVDVIFYPNAKEMYPNGFKTNVSVKEITDIMCGKSRPGHFDGVATVVLKLFNIVKPTKAYFGKKDAQQLAVIRQMVNDLNLDVEIVGCEIVREHDGLAMSSRNTYLNEKQRKIAPILYKSLLTAKDMILQGEKNSEVIKNKMSEMILEKEETRIDYIEIVDYNSFEIVDEIKGKVLISLAVFVGNTRLIDNITVEV